MAGAACAWLALAAHAGKPLSVLSLSRDFGSAEEAARAALSIAMARSEEHEYAGAIFRLKGRYFYSEPVTNGQRKGCVYDAEAPAGSRLVGIYHTHPPHELDEYFSAEDVLTAQRLRVKSYLGVVAKGHVRVFDPARMQPSFIWRKEDYGRMSPGKLLAPASTPAP